VFVAGMRTIGCVLVLALAIVSVTGVPLTKRSSTSTSATSKDDASDFYPLTLKTYLTRSGLFKSSEWPRDSGTNEAKPEAVKKLSDKDKEQAEARLKTVKEYSDQNAKINLKKFKTPVRPSDDSFTSGDKAFIDKLNFIDSKYSAVSKPKTETFTFTSGAQVLIRWDDAMEPSIKAALHDGFVDGLNLLKKHAIEPAKPNGDSAVVAELIISKWSASYKVSNPNVIMEFAIADSQAFQTNDGLDYVVTGPAALGFKMDTNANPPLPNCVSDRVITVLKERASASAISATTTATAVGTNVRRSVFSRVFSRAPAWAPPPDHPTHWFRERAKWTAIHEFAHTLHHLKSTVLFWELKSSSIKGIDVKHRAALSSYGAGMRASPHEFIAEMTTKIVATKEGIFDKAWMATDDFENWWKAFGGEGITAYNF